MTSPKEARTDRRKARTRGHPRARERGQLLLQDRLVMRPAPAPGQDDRWSLKERSASREQLCVWRRLTGWGAF